MRMESKKRTYVEPEGVGVVDGDVPDREVGRIGSNCLEARVQTSSLGKAGSIEGGLCDSVVLLAAVKKKSSLICEALIHWIG